MRNRVINSDLRRIKQLIAQGFSVGYISRAMKITEEALTPQMPKKAETPKKVVAPKKKAAKKKSVKKKAVKKDADNNIDM